MDSLTIGDRELPGTRVEKHPLRNQQDLLSHLHNHNGGHLGELVITNLSDRNYTQSLVFYRLQVQAYHQTIPSDQIFDTIWKHRGTKIVETWANFTQTPILSRIGPTSDT